MLTLYLGDAGSLAEARNLVQHHRQQSFDERLERNDESWRDFADALQVETPDPAFDALVNTWLPYQAFACRIRARAAFYQASGAYGFRDQLQDTLALLLHDASLARAQILNAAGRQFREGDVQHWWLPRSGAGVRTMISDDVVWLAHGTHRYVSVTGDAAILDENLPFLEGEMLQEGQHDAFFTPQTSKETASLYEHCARALDLAIRRTGPHGLPLILGGDWNDGMNRVGEKGRGESVWLGWFLAATLRDFAVVADERGDAKRAEAWRRHLDQLKIAIEDAGWDGEWYRRGYFDDGSPLGSRQSDECRIDSLAQSWAVLSGLGPEDRANQAMTSAQEWLLDEEHGLIRLFTPPFENTPKEPGYIKGYPPGVRENGGQYTHAATWFVLALAALGRSDDAYRAFSVINPVNHALGPRPVPTSIVSSLTSSLPMSTRRPTVRAVAAGHGIRARRDGSTGPPWRAFSASSGPGKRSQSRRAFPPTGRDSTRKCVSARPSTEFRSSAVQHAIRLFLTERRCSK